MKLDLKSGEHLRIANDTKGGFVILIGDGFIHIRAGAAKEPTSILITNEDVGITRQDSENLT